MGIKAFNHLPFYIKKLSEDMIQFENTLKKLSFTKFFLFTE
jgi:hypothetical protein